jgi:hypothetical protein
MLEAIGSWPGAVWLQQSGTAYLFVNAAHILGIGILLGGILPLDLRLMGLFGRYPLEVLGPFLTRSAATGLGLALFSGAWLFSVKPEEYLANNAFRWKVALLVLALSNVALQHRGTRLREWRPTPATRIAAGLSLGLWLGVLIAGRWIGFL